MDSKFEFWLQRLIAALLLMVVCLFYTAVLVVGILVLEAVLPVGGTLLAICLMLVGTAAFIKVERL